jgi:hypothetical protein
MILGMRDEKIEKFIAYLEEEFREIEKRVVRLEVTSALGHFMTDAVERAAIKAGFLPCEEVKRLDLILFDEQGNAAAAVEVEQKYEDDVKKAVGRLKGIKIPWKILIIHPLGNERNKEKENSVWERAKNLVQEARQEDEESWLLLRVLSRDEPFAGKLGRRIFMGIERYPS